MTNQTLGRFPARSAALSLAIAIATQAAPVFAQDEEASATALEEVIVTGTKRDVSQQDLPIAVSTITAAQLEKTFQNDVTELGQLSPNVTLTPLRDSGIAKLTKLFSEELVTVQSRKIEKARHDGKDVSGAGS